MTIVGMWIAIIGYGIAFAGYSKLNGGQCSIIDAFRNRCWPASKVTSATSSAAGTTLLAAQQAAHQQQAAMIGTQAL